ncbi:MAG TPA: metalloregulator ArsR/SmtB family transcription factor [Candidatus Micrarchaeota archaeon]|nr:metalloregulator ArsR/SmtB family transcription factor [Candidatus Micrarchaeota archaeon]
MAKKHDSGFELFRALGDRTRYNITSALLDGEKCACELPGLVKRAQPTVSLQLKCLEKAGIVESRRDGKKRLYRISSRLAREMLEGAGKRSHGATTPD